MGLFGFGGDDVPQLNLPDFPTLQTAGEARGIGTQFGKQETPLAYGAREGALSDLARGTEFYEQFQPTSFEQALGQQSFANIMPDVERSIKHNLSLSGIESSPVLAEQIGQARGTLGVDIGNILAQLGQQRATQSLTARLGIDPISQIINPIAGQELERDYQQQQGNYNQAVAQALADYQREIEQQNRKSQGISSIGSIAGAGLGMLAAPFTGGMSIPAGAALGGSLGGTAAGIFGGSQSPISMGDALSIMKAFPVDFKNDPKPQPSQASTQGRATNVFNMQGIGQNLGGFNY